ncbi:hypothetical protein GCM10027184_26050 [Saccharothrix stipae]
MARAGVGQAHDRNAIDSVRERGAGSVDNTSRHRSFPAREMTWSIIDMSRANPVDPFSSAVPVCAEKRSGNGGWSVYYGRD